MSQTLKVLNEKIFKQIKKDKRIYFSKENIVKSGLALIFSVLAFSVNYKIGAVFMLPILCSMLHF